MPVLAMVIMLVLCAAPASALIPGGGPSSRDCWAGFEAGGLSLNTPPFNPAKPRPAKELRCFDGEAGCDLDGVVDGACTFDVDVCLHQTDASLPECTPVEVVAASVRGAEEDVERNELQQAVAALLPATSPVCTDGATLRLPVPPKGGRGKARVVLATETADGRTKDALRLGCVPHGWPSDGYDYRNTRATATETLLSPANAAQLRELWTLDIAALEPPALSSVTSTPTVADGRVYVTSWNGKVYALDARTGHVRWRYDTGALPIGVQSAATLTADGRLIVPDGSSRVHALEARTGKLLWIANLSEVPEDHVWGSPQVARGMVWVGIAGFADQPCAQGRLVALDLDSGAVRWTRRNVPGRVCHNDTAIACTSDADCGGAPCDYARGAGVTAAPALNASATAVYTNSVGCYTFPSIGDSDSVMRLDAVTGADVWVTRVTPPEQFGACASIGAIDCRSDADCPSGDTCQKKIFYHDFGFLNGPLLVPAAGGADLVVSASKDGSIYAFDPDDGTIVWTQAVAPVPVTPGFAGFGLFNGAIGFAAGRLHAALNDLIPPLNPPPDHLMAFDAATGAPLWQDDIPASWGHVGLANGVLFTGANNTPLLFVYDAATGTRLTTLALPDKTVSGPSIVDGVVYVGYSVSALAGGVRAFALPK